MTEEQNLSIQESEEQLLHYSRLYRDHYLSSFHEKHVFQLMDGLPGLIRRVPPERTHMMMEVIDDFLLALKAQEMRNCGQRTAAVVAAAVSVEGMWRRVLSTEEEEEEMAGEACPICLREFKMGHALRMGPCSHGFHGQCIFEWLVQKDSCPMCRSKLRYTT